MTRMHAERHLIVNADDFGYAAGVNQGIIDANESGIVTSTSLMVYQPAAAEAARYARENSRLSVGIHLDLGEWVYRDGDWVPLYQRVALEDPFDVENEVRQQFEAFRDLLGRDPTHIDSHQNVHLRGAARGVAIQYGRTIGIPVRHLSSRVRYCGAFYGQTAEGDPLPERISSQALIELVTALSLGITELGCHPGYPTGLASVYARERAGEVDTLCDPAVRAGLESLHIELVSFSHLSAIGVL